MFIRVTAQQRALSAGPLHELKCTRTPACSPASSRRSRTSEPKSICVRSSTSGFEDTWFVARGGVSPGDGQSVGEHLASNVVEARVSQSEKRDTPRAQQVEDGLKRHRLGHFGVKAQLNPLRPSIVRGIIYIHLKVEIIDACSSTLTTCGRRITSSIRAANLESMFGSIGAPIRDTLVPPWRMFAVALSNADAGTRFSRLTRLLGGAASGGDVDCGSTSSVDGGLLNLKVYTGTQAQSRLR